MNIANKSEKIFFSSHSSQSNNKTNFNKSNRELPKINKELSVGFIAQSYNKFVVLKNGFKKPLPIHIQDRLKRASSKESKRA